MVLGVGGGIKAVVVGVGVMGGMVAGAGGIWGAVLGRGGVGGALPGVGSTAGAVAGIGPVGGVVILETAGTAGLGSATSFPSCSQLQFTLHDLPAYGAYPLELIISQP